MRAKDLHKYKTLDITELSGSPWNTAEKVLGLDENDKVVMAEPEELVTPEYVDNAIDQAMEAETARTESTYLKEHQSLDDYATKQYVDDAISEIDLSDYYTKEEVDEAIENVDVSDQLVNYALISSVTEDINTAIANETARTENTYAKPSDIPSLDGYAKTTAVTQDIQTAIASETARTENVYAKKSEIPDLDNYYTKSETDEAITAATDDMATETWVQNQGYLTQHQDISGKLDVSTFNTYTGATETVLEGKADLSDIPDVSDFVTSGDVATQIGTAMAAETARTEETYAKIGDVPEVDLNPAFPRMPYFSLDNGGGDIEQVKSAIFDVDDSGNTKSNIWLMDTAFDWLDSNVYDWENGQVNFIIDPEEKVAYVENIPAGNYIFALGKGGPGENYGSEFDVWYWSKEEGGWSNYTIESTQDIWDSEDFDIDEYWRNKFEGNIVLTNSGEWYNWSFPKDVERLEIRISEVPGVGDEYLEINITYKEYATEEWVEDQGYLTEHQDLSDYAKTTAVTQAIQTAIAAETARTESTYLKEHQDISGKLDVSTFNTYTGATETVLEGKADISDIPDVSGFVTSGDVETQIGAAMSSETARTESAYVKLSTLGNTVLTGTKPQENSLQFFVKNTSTGAETTKNVYFKTINGEGLVDKNSSTDISLPTFNDVSTAITDSMATETARTESTYAKKSEIPDLDDYATKEYVDKNLSGYTETGTVEIGDVSDNVSIVVFNTPQGDKTVYFSGTNVDNIYVLRHSDIGGQEEFSSLYIDGVRYYPTTGGMPSASIPAEVPATGIVFEISTTVREVGWYYADSTSPEYFIIDTDALTASFTSTLPTYTLTVPGKQDTLVSGTNIKTINNQSLLGSGNIDIQGGGGGGSVVELTKAQYEALDPPAADTTYIITDADVVDLNDYAPASGLTELSGTVQTISSNYATKQNVTANTSLPYFPTWNNQGVITGNGTRAYTKSSQINGTTYYVYSERNDTRPSFYAPTSAGTAGQPLLSNGSGAPVWGGYKFAFITQTQYDALVTKDATTIYFITGD